MPWEVVSKLRYKVKGLKKNKTLESAYIIYHTGHLKIHFC